MKDCALISGHGKPERSPLSTNAGPRAGTGTHTGRKGRPVARICHPARPAGSLPRYRRGAVPVRRMRQCRIRSGGQCLVLPSVFLLRLLPCPLFRPADANRRPSSAHSFPRAPAARRGPVRQAPAIAAVARKGGQPRGVAHDLPPGPLPPSGVHLFAHVALGAAVPSTLSQLGRGGIRPSRSSTTPATRRPLSRKTTTAGFSCPSTQAS